MSLSRDSVKCAVCGGSMKMIAVVAVKMGRVRRYKCTCGHLEDLKEDKTAPTPVHEILNLEGFQEIP